jgi:hypothetical protein
MAIESITWVTWNYTSLNEKFDWVFLKQMYQEKQILVQSYEQLKKNGGNKMKKLLLLIVMFSCSGCGLLAANPGRYSYPYPEPHPCVYPCQQDDDGHYIYHTHTDKD